MHHEFHEFSAMFPLMEGKDFAELVEDIKTHGQRECIVLFDGKILDGRNRYRACEALGIEPRLRELTCIDGDPLEFVWSQNVQRRHLNGTQRAMAITRRMEFHNRGQAYVKQDRKRDGKFGGRILKMNDSVITAHQAAQIANVPINTIEKARNVIKHGTPEEINQVETNQKKLHSVYATIRERRQEEGIKSRGVKINVPKGADIIEWTQEAITTEKSKTVAEAAEAIGMSLQSYRKLRDIVQLYSKIPDLPLAEKAMVIDAIEDVRETHQVTQAHQSLTHIISRVWGQNGAKNVKTEQRKLENFDHAINAITFSAMAEVEIPQMPITRANQIIDDLEDAQDNIGHLIQRIKETYHV